MKVYDAGSIRNVALVGHTGSGKTQLASAILSDTGMVNRFGKVMPKDFKRVLKAREAAERDGRDVNEAIMEAAHG